MADFGYFLDLLQLVVDDFDALLEQPALGNVPVLAKDVLFVVPGKHGFEIVLLACHLDIVIVLGSVTRLLNFPEIALELFGGGAWYLLEDVLAQKIAAVLHEPSVRMYFQINT
jgi:hypothetical protein